MSMGNSYFGLQRMALCPPATTYLGQLCTTNGAPTRHVTKYLERQAKLKITGDDFGTEQSRKARRSRNFGHVANIQQGDDE